MRISAFSLHILLCATVFIPAGIIARESSARWTATLEPGKRFIENKSQFNGKNLLPGTEILFGVDAQGTRIFFTKSGLTYRFDVVNRKDEGEEREELMRELMSSGNEQEAEEKMEEWREEEREFDVTTDVVHLQWVDANPDVQVIPQEVTADYFSYTFGERNHYSNVNYIKGYKKLLYQNLYPGVDVEYSFYEDGMKYA